MIKYALNSLMKKCSEKTRSTRAFLGGVFESLRNISICYKNSIQRL